MNVNEGASLSGAAARTGNLKEIERNIYIKLQVWGFESDEQNDRILRCK